MLGGLSKTSQRCVCKRTAQETAASAAINAGGGVELTF